MNRLRTLLSFIFIGFFVSSCGGKYVPSPTGAPEETSTRQTESAPGTMGLANPLQGLEALPAYRAILKISFEDDPQSAWSQSYILTTDKEQHTRWMEYAEEGLGDQSPQYPALVGSLDGIVYYRSAPEGNCVSNFAEADDDWNSALPEPAGMLPPVKSMVPDGEPELVNGVQAMPYHLNAGSFGGDAQQVSGQVWLAQAGDYVVKYTLTVQGGEELFGPDVSGVMQWAYEITPLEAHTAALPADCPIALPDLPQMNGAAGVIKFPGFISYDIQTNQEDVAAFYEGELASRGYEPLIQTRVGEAGMALSYGKNGQAVQVVYRSGQPGEVMLYSQPVSEIPVRETAELQVEATEAPVSPPVNLADRIVGSLDVLLGDDRTPSAFASFHLESTDQAPAWDRKSETVGSETTSFSVDIQDKNIHFVQHETRPGANQETTEVYMMGSDEYEVVNNQVEPSLGLASLAWIMYSIDPTTMLSIGALEAASAEAETVEGRSAEVYDLAGSSDSSGGILAGFGYSSVQGKVWIDSETGALLKMEADYEKDVRNTAGEVKGSGSGHFSLLVSGIGEVTVSLP